MKDIRDELCKDTPQKTEINKPYIDDMMLIIEIDN